MTLVFCLHIADRMSSVVPLPCVSKFKPYFTVIYFVGQGFSNLIPSMLAFSQGVGDTEYFTLHDSNGTPIVTTWNILPLFSFTFFYMIFGLTVSWSLSFFVLHEWKPQKFVTWKSSTIICVKCANHWKRSKCSFLFTLNTTISAFRDGILGSIYIKIHAHAVRFCTLPLGCCIERHRCTSRMFSRIFCSTFDYILWHYKSIQSKKLKSHLPYIWTQITASVLYLSASINSRSDYCFYAHYCAAIIQRRRLLIQNEMKQNEFFTIIIPQARLQFVQNAMISVIFFISLFRVAWFSNIDQHTLLVLL